MDSCQVGGGDYGRLGLADKLQFSALLWPDCAKNGILYLHGGQRETGIPEPHEPGHIRECRNEVRAKCQCEEIWAANSTVPEPPPLAVWRSTQTGGAEAAARAGVEAGRVAKVERGGPKEEGS